MRYYAQWLNFPESGNQEFWCVFDRMRLTNQGEVKPICACISRAVAFNIRDTLNHQENERDKQQG